MDESENELLILEFIHHFVEILDRYFGNVCELDLIFNFVKVYMILDELVIGEQDVCVCDLNETDGLLYESSKKAVLRAMATQDALMEESMTSSRISL